MDNLLNGVAIFLFVALVLHYGILVYGGFQGAQWRDPRNALPGRFGAAILVASWAMTFVGLDIRAFYCVAAGAYIAAWVGLRKDRSGWFWQFGPLFVFTTEPEVYSFSSATAVLAWAEAGKGGQAALAMGYRKGRWVEVVIQIARDASVDVVRDRQSWAEVCVRDVLEDRVVSHSIQLVARRRGETPPALGGGSGFNALRRWSRSGRVPSGGDEVASVVGFKAVANWQGWQVHVADHQGGVRFQVRDRTLCTVSKLESAWRTRGLRFTMSPQLPGTQLAVYLGGDDHPIMWVIDGSWFAEGNIASLTTPGR